MRLSRSLVSPVKLGCYDAADVDLITVAYDDVPDERAICVVRVPCES